jgi:hypothetical protein
MPDLHTLVELVAQQIEDELEVHTFGVCDTPAVVITAGRPAAPLHKCSAVYVWLDSTQEVGGQATFGQIAGPDCISRRTATIGVEAGICLNDPGAEDIDPATSAVEAECFNELVDVVTCGLGDAAVGGLFGDCAGVTVGSFQTQPRAGGWVSSLGSVTLDAVCDLTPGS